MIMNMTVDKSKELESGIEELSSDITTLETKVNAKVNTSDLNWKLFKTIPKEEQVSLPTSFKEILLVHRNTYNNNGYISYTFRYYLTKTELDIRLNGLTSSQYVSLKDRLTDEAYATWRLYGNKTIKLYSAQYNTSSTSLHYQEGSVTYLYYR